MLEAAAPSTNSLPAPPPLPAAAALEQSGCNLSEASRRLGIARNTLKARMRLYGL